MDRLARLAISRGIPPSAAREVWKRADVHTRNKILKH
jgi:hypothetical protein